MAKHFKQESQRGTSPTKKMPSPRPQDASRAKSNGSSQYVASQPYGYSDPANARRIHSAQRNDFYLDDEQEIERGGIFRLGRGLCLLVAVPVRILAIVLFVLVMLNAMPVKPIMHYVSYLTDLLTLCIPWQSLRVLAVDTPFGGSFRCDLCIFSLFLFVIDWLFCRIRAALV